MSGNAPHKITLEELVSLNENKSSYILLAGSYLSNKSQAEDIFQESLLYLLENHTTIEVQNVKWYFSRMILNKCLYHLRQTRNQSRIRENIKNAAILEENIRILSDITSDTTIFKTDFDGCIKECRQILPEQTFRIFLDAKVKGLTYKDIADLYGITQRHVTSEIQRALKVFRRVFKDYWFLFFFICDDIQNYL